jgi:hypothetical protein
MKKISVMVFTRIMLFVVHMFCITVFATANSDIGISVNGQVVQFAQPVRIDQGTILAPIRRIIDMVVGARGSLNENTQKASVFYVDTEVAVTVGNPNMSVVNRVTGATQTVALPVNARPRIYEGIAYWPVEYIFRELGLIVQMNDTTRILQLNTPSFVLSTQISQATPSSNIMPREILDARNNAPQDVLVGVGNARMGTAAQSRDIAATRARAQLVIAMQSMVRGMINDYLAANEIDLSVAIVFQENVAVALSRSQLSNAVIQTEISDGTGGVWVVMYLSRANVLREINQAQAIARLATPAWVAFDSLARMDEAVRRASEW